MSFAVVVQSLSRVLLFATPWAAEHQASLSFTIFQTLLKLMSIESVMPSNHLILCCLLLLLASIFPSIRVFSNEPALRIWWPKYWSFSFSISPSIEYLRLISFRIDWFALLAVQWILKNLLQHHSSTFVGKVMSLLFNMLSRLVIAFLPRSKRLLISWLQSPSAEILEPKKIKFVIIFIVSLYIYHEVMGPDAMILVF